MTKHKLELVIEGPGTHATMYMVDEPLIKRLRENAKSAAPVSVMDIVKEGALDSTLVSYGISENEFEVHLSVDGKKFNIETIGRFEPEDGEDFADCYSFERSEMLTYADDNVKGLGEGKEEIADGVFIILEVIEYASGQIKTMFDIADPDLKVEDLLLNLVDTDMGNKDHCGPYDLGLINAVECDIRSVTYKNVEHAFSLTMEESTGGGLYLLKRNEYEEWREDHTAQKYLQPDSEFDISSDDDDAIDLEALAEMDKGTLSPDRADELLEAMAVAGTPYTAYAQRVGPGLATLASEIKRELERTLMPVLTPLVGKLTQKRFQKVYCDVRVYPESRETETWDCDDNWSEATLQVLVSFVLAIPEDDSLDSMARLTLVSLFEDTSWDPAVKKLGKKGHLKEKLNVDLLSDFMGECNFENFNPFEFNGFQLEIIFDGCPIRDFERLSELAKGEVVPADRRLKGVFSGTPEEITAENAETAVPVLIAAIANVLGVTNLDPTQLQRGDSLYALMGFDEGLTRSLSLSITGHFNVLYVAGGNRIVTVGNAIDFAIETITFREDDE